jgi:hypothetical protein
MATIEIQRLSKRFADIRAVDGLTFTAREGAVTGFLGPTAPGSPARCGCCDLRRQLTHHLRQERLRRRTHRLVPARPDGPWPGSQLPMTRSATESPHQPQHVVMRRHHMSSYVRPQTNEVPTVSLRPIQKVAP